MPDPARMQRPFIPQAGAGDAPTPAGMSREVFERFRHIVHARSGIALKEGKESLVAARIAKRMRALQLSDPAHYLDVLDRDPSGDELVQLIDAISTNVTSFFREPEHFAFLADVAGTWMASGQKKFRLWSAACSSGEEAYTMAMVMRDAAGDAALDIKILATDISTRVLRSCAQGRYGAEQLKEVSPDFRVRHFDAWRESNDTVYSVKPELRRMVVFRPLNLSRFPYPMKGPLDVVFCRNVMIYFNRDLCSQLLSEVQRLLRKGGYLMTGHAEGLACMHSGFEVIRPSIYRK